MKITTFKNLLTMDLYLDNTFNIQIIRHTVRIRPYFSKSVKRKCKIDGSFSYIKVYVLYLLFSIQPWLTISISLFSLLISNRISNADVNHNLLLGLEPALATLPQRSHFTF